MLLIEYIIYKNQSAEVSNLIFLTKLMLIELFFET